MRLIKKLIFIIVFAGFGSSLNAQPFGFGCLGLSGFYAGFSRQNYQSPGLNDYISQRINILDPAKNFITENIEFKQGTGYRIGANLFRAKWDKFFISAKGYYQFLRESYEVSAQVASVDTREKYQLTMNHWGVGIDLGVPLFGILDWKIAEAHVMFYNSDFIQETFLDNSSQGEIKFQTDKNNIGYFIGTGMILHLIPDYISLEGTVGYNIIQIDKFTNSSGIVVPAVASTKKAVDKGDLSITLQLNVGFPL